MAADEPVLRPGEEIISNRDEKLWRQVHPVWVQDGRVTSQLFSPTPKDSGELSTTRSSIVSAESAHQHHTEAMGLKSVGVYSVSVSDVEDVDLLAVDDSKAEGGDNRPPGHAFIDFKRVSSPKQIRKRASILRDKAESGGWRHRSASE
ncbi:hypothetical protein [Streptomyces sp. XY511]|uniref:hypothetical protein n=1 Tax=Streptomyces sp. XY511 TaxID=1519480 RepID=UPI00131BEC3D|nr:hypothetical protein [Streptomyces sp. XY511]